MYKLESSESPLKIAVLFLVFNRLDVTKRVFEAIRQAKPPRLYISADGARDSKEGETIVVAEVREYILSNIDWECEIKTLFREENLGCKYAVSGGIDWFFEHEEMGIILEDDCLPDLSFFSFCEKLLNENINNSQVGLIAGTSFLLDETESQDDYFFSKYIPIWGWATWRRAWKGYDVAISDWNLEVSKSIPLNYINWDKEVGLFFSQAFDSVFSGELDTWDYQFVFHCMKSHFGCLTPYNNLISNIGLSGVRDFSSNPFINMPRKSLDSLVLSGSDMVKSAEVDKRLFYNLFYKHIRYKFLKKIPGLYFCYKRLKSLFFK